MTFDFDKAYAAFKDSPHVQEWMTLNKDDLVALTEQAILEFVATYVVSGAATIPIVPATLEQQGAVLVGNAADIARRRYEAGQRLTAIGKIGLQLFLSVLAAGVVL